MFSFNPFSQIGLVLSKIQGFLKPCFFLRNSVSLRSLTLFQLYDVYIFSTGDFDEMLLGYFYPFNCIN